MLQSVMATLTTIRRTLKARDIPSAWHVDLPDAPVEVAITPLPRVGDSGSPRRFFGAGKDLFGSAAEIDAYIRRERDAWEE